MNKINKYKFYVMGIFLLCIIVLVVKFQLYNITIVRKYVLSYGKLAPFIFFVLCILRPILLLPIGLFSVLGGILFGPIKGTFITVLGSTIGSLIAYYISWFLGADFFKEFFGDIIEKYYFDDKNAFKITFVMRVVPILPCDFVSYICGLSKINVIKYTIASFLGIIPGTFIYSYFGHSLNNIYSKEFIFSIVMIVILTIIPILIKHYKKKDEYMDVEIDPFYRDIDR
ncbi:TVP38/TMEM64 family protein [Thermobrachium celere]|uniref:TVP38/TMEM64 family protein n=1 Tax=Thermobrachium celere TaxID=53422 RepID=UPI0019442E08|nr:TVP38/TMEM64 family protein [Thermobrachium celere]GFR36266.1 DedA family protein [Thermobrachium celere]